MNPQRHAAAVTTALTTVEALADAQGWDACPAVLGLFDSTSHTGVGNLDVEELPIDPSVWQLHAVLGTRLKLPYRIGFHAVVDVLTTVKVTELRAWAHAQLGPLLAVAFLGEGLDTSESGRRDAAALGLPVDDDGIAVRSLTARDVHGRRYQILRYRGAATTTGVVLDHAPAQPRDRGIYGDLRRLLAAAHG
ncbi:hypothetical protein EEZ25_22100 [Micromonospora aurantiaca]|uniref:hypothetical protein n=1 Tax=Micromonospora aurantiaca (nom. illeg.) TaxID=47850 RepID=UPI000F404FB6|nr:hypothetical protein [Micromonospora aurantiaca]RNH99680.1 hypothetical protein EEZ25_22100 [Micromonospora aurantiaca]